jgi:adenylate kinase
VLDGFPRTVAQAEALDGLMGERDPLIIVEMLVADEEIVRRVKSRRVCSVCGASVSAFGGKPLAVKRCQHCGGALVTRADDTETVVRERLKVYWRETRPMIEYYRDRATFRRLNGAQAPEAVRSELESAIFSVAGVLQLVVPQRRSA